MSGPGVPRAPRSPLVHEVAALERTALAWERTAISLGAVGLMLLKVVDGGRLVQGTGLLLLAAAVAIVLVVVPVGYRRARGRVAVDDPEQPFAAPDRWRALALVATAVLVSLTGVAVAADLWVLRLG